jgi:hypothetical protein
MLELIKSDGTKATGVFKTSTKKKLIPKGSKLQCTVMSVSNSLVSEREQKDKGQFYISVVFSVDSGEFAGEVRENKLYVNATKASTLDRTIEFIAVYKSTGKLDKAFSRINDYSQITDSMFNVFCGDKFLVTFNNVESKWIDKTGEEKITVYDYIDGLEQIQQSKPKPTPVIEEEFNDEEIPF